MVEVLERGSKTIINCDFCGSKLKYRKDDIKEAEYFESQRSTHIEKYIICPECGEKININKNNKTTISDKNDVQKLFLHNR